MAAKKDILPGGTSPVDTGEVVGTNVELHHKEEQVVPTLSEEILRREWAQAQAEALYRLRRTLQGK